MMRTLLKLGTIAACSITVAVLPLVNGCSPPKLYSASRTGAGPVGSPYASSSGADRSQIGSQSRLLPFSNARSRSSREDAPNGSLPALDEEVWVIVKPQTATTTDPESMRMSANRLVPGRVSRHEGDHDNFYFYPGTGALMCRMPPPDRDGPPRTIPLPLKHTEVRVTVNAYIASVNVTQQFSNPYTSKIEAVYAFPLPDNAAVNGFVMTIGERRIRGIIREREEAQNIYNDAKSQGYVASLITQERPNIFTQSVANIEPGRQVNVDIIYFHTLSYDDGWYEFVFPMVIGLRFNPSSSGDGIGAIARNDRGASGQATEIQYLAPNERSGHDIGLTVDLMPGTSIEEVVCRSHKVEVNNEFSEHVRIALKPSDSIPNKDFVLRYRVAGDTVKTALLVHRDAAGGNGEAAGGGYFTFMLIPPRHTSVVTKPKDHFPMEMIFVIDCSGSMDGEPIKQVKSAVDHALKQLQPNDTFQIVQFANNASQLGRYPLPATADNIRRGRDYVKRLSGDGGTMMIHGINAALDVPHDPSRTRIVTFLTDGYIGNESEILSATHDRVGESRIFSFGVGSSANRFLMDRMAKMGRGAVAYLSLKDKGDDVMDAFFTRVSQPVLSDIAIDWGEMHVKDVMPARIPDLYVGRPVVITGRFAGEPPTSIQVSGQAEMIAGAWWHNDDSGGMWRGDWPASVAPPTTRWSKVEARFPVDLAPASTTSALTSVWARLHIAELMDRALWDRNASELPQQVTTLALQYGLMSAYTSFVAVDASGRTAGDHGTTVSVAVPVPEGARYDTTVQDK